jgi:hypothetical protein
MFSPLASALGNQGQLSFSVLISSMNEEQQASVICPFSISLPPSLIDQLVGKLSIAKKLF